MYNKCGRWQLTNLKYLFKNGGCTTCRNGKWGTECKLNCSINCESDTNTSNVVTCKKADGACTSVTCKKGYWGTKCSQVRSIISTVPDIELLRLVISL